MLNFFAHAGHDHQPATTSIAIAVPELLIFIGLTTGLLLFWLLTTFVIKISLAKRLFVLLFALLATGVGGYWAAPIVSTIALATGFALALAVVFLPFMVRR